MELRREELREEAKTMAMYLNNLRDARINQLVNQLMRQFSDFQQTFHQIYSIKHFLGPSAKRRGDLDILGQLTTLMSSPKRPLAILSPHLALFVVSFVADMVKRPSEYAKSIAVITSEIEGCQDYFPEVAFPSFFDSFYTTEMLDCGKEFITTLADEAPASIVIPYFLSYINSAFEFISFISSRISESSVEKGEKISTNEAVFKFIKILETASTLLPTQYVEIMRLMKRKFSSSFYNLLCNNFLYSIVSRTLDCYNTNPFSTAIERFLSYASKHPQSPQYQLIEKSLFDSKKRLWRPPHRCFVQNHRTVLVSSIYSLYLLYQVVKHSPNLARIESFRSLPFSPEFNLDYTVITIDISTSFSDLSIFSSHLLPHPNKIQKCDQNPTFSRIWEHMSYENNSIYSVPTSEYIQGACQKDDPYSVILSNVNVDDFIDFCSYKIIEKAVYELDQAENVHTTAFSLSYIRENSLIVLDVVQPLLRALTSHIFLRYKRQTQATPQTQVKPCISATMLHEKFKRKRKILDDEEGSVPDILMTAHFKSDGMRASPTSKYVPSLISSQGSSFQLEDRIDTNSRSKITRRLSNEHITSKNWIPDTYRVFDSMINIELKKWYLLSRIDSCCADDIDICGGSKRFEAVIKYDHSRSPLIPDKHEKQYQYLASLLDTLLFYRPGSRIDRLARISMQIKIFADTRLTNASFKDTSLIRADEFLKVFKRCKTAAVFVAFAWYTRLLHTYPTVYTVFSPHQQKALEIFYGSFSVLMHDLDRQLPSKILSFSEVPL